MSQELLLTQGYTALVDDEDFKRINRYQWSTFISRNKDGTIKNVYAIRNIKRGEKHTTQRMHRFILGVTDPQKQVDHKDHDGLNNQKKNLRKATGEQNQRNQKLSKRNTSGFKGVHWRKDVKQYTAYIQVNGKLLHLGFFIDPLEAACAYDMAAVKHFGEFAHCNFAIPN